jgi:hypothetical protein
VLPLDACDGIRVPDDEDPELRTAMDERLLDLVDDPELVGSVGTVLAVSGSPRPRLRQVLVAVESGVRDLGLERDPGVMQEARWARPRHHRRPLPDGEPPQRRS